MRLFKTFVFMGFFLFVFDFVYSQDDYKGKMIRSIDFNGLKNIKENDLGFILNSYLGQLYSDELFDRLQIDLYALDYFEGFIRPEFKLEDDKLAITFFVKEKSLINTVTFIDYSGVFWNSELRDKSSVKVKDALNLSKVKKSVVEFEEMYKDAGYLDVSVEFDVKEENALVDIVFKINAGPKYVVKEVSFEGNLNFKSSTLRKYLVSKTASLFFDGKYLESNVAKDKVRLESYYKNNGYVNAKVVNNTVDIQDPVDSKKLEKGVYLKYFISEGDVFKFGKFEIIGNLVFQLEELQSLITFKEGDIFDDSRFEQDFAKIREKYYSDGYIFTEIVPSRIIRDEFVDYSIKIFEREKAHIESITVSGNKRTSDHVILREIPLVEGDIFSLERLRMGMLNLQRIGYFGNVIPDIVPSNTEGLMKINFTVEERETASFRFGMNFGGVSNSWLPFSIFGQWEESNFLGEGYSLSARLNLAFSEQSFRFMFEDNWFMQTRWTVGGFIDFSHSINTAYQDINGPIFVGKKEVPDPFVSWVGYNGAKNFSDYNFMNYSLAKFSISGFTGYNFLNYLGKQSFIGTVQTALKYVYYDNNVNRPSNYYLRDNHNTVRFENSLGFSIAWDTRNSQSLSNNGFLLKQQFDFFGGFLFGQSHFSKSTTTFERYFSLLGYQDVFNSFFDLILTLRSVYSNILPPLGNGFEIELQPHHLIVISENFMIARGWGILNNIYSSFVNTVQLSMPLIKNILVWDILFLDVASYSLEGQDNALFVPFDNFIFSWGFGVRSVLPQMPLSLVIAYPFHFNNAGVNRYHDFYGGFKFFLAVDMRY
ncbi:Putative outer membrane protein assembly factor [Borrelia miyamotoi]|uniref:Outer membrane protein assembly factor BamA n=2 Tax=Borrelia miyamotoi TaxID=47466 RepID=A0AAP8YV35_9SPIR|nr:outer membrane protein assembly factor BamA [Borrelia miyamotoi]AHH04599.1 Outer membrane protein [Borrelia miyamotoi FR64b]ATQ14472.1 outer membrane protein assembly factor BamA [Borrelia miyamotoi]ATQ15657.1 outer membrane protein assembly factor BamA [Borrelia miyamotoi]ATQ16801.1 outer membrane protein assembly factor BamA [Borrelia miyamotoi]ATQ18696.1 outer membrane protein assembly factor BamA [Borrelia miyamotoi]